MSAVPKLRFSEFDGIWKETTLGAESTCLDTTRVPLEANDRQSRQGPYPYYGASGVIDYIDDYLFDEELVLLAEDGANIINRNSPIAFLASGKYWVNNHAHVYRAKGSSLFLATYLENLRYEKYNTGTAQPKLNGSVCKSLKLKFPSLPEQKKLADFLGAVDNKIAGLRERERLLTQYKKGVMQKIFTQALRFKAEDGSDFPDWGKRDLGEICEITTGRLDANAAVDGGEFPFYTCAKDVFAIDIAAFDTEALLISGNGANVGYIHYCEGKFNAYQRTYVLDKFEANIFYIEQFLIKNLKKRIYSEAKEGNTPYIVMGTLTELQVQLPHPDEQQKIADFLSAIDEKITTVSAQITQMQDFKKGLLQQMFV